MREHNCHQFVFSSSATVYGDQPAPLYETAQTGGCSNPYGWTKFMIEEILKGACRADPALSVVLLRYFNPIGAHESGLIGENPNGIPNNLMPYITQVAIGRRERLTVFGDDYDTPDGTGVRDYIHVVDLAEGHLCAIRYAQAHTGCEVFNLGTGRGVSVLEMVHTFSEVNNVPVPYRHRPAPRRRSGHGLRRPRQGKADPWLGGKENACRYVPRQLALADPEPVRILSPELSKNT